VIIGVTDYGTTMGVDDPAEVPNWSKEEFEARRKKGSEMLLKAGADEVIPDLRSLTKTLEIIAKQRMGVELEAAVKLR
jgi:hypothetical protein